MNTTQCFDLRALHDLMLLIGYDVPVEHLYRRTLQELKHADEWAQASYSRASDNDVTVPMAPSWVAVYKNGPAKVGFCQCPYPVPIPGKESTDDTLCAKCNRPWKPTDAPAYIKKRDVTAEEPKEDMGGGATRTKKLERFDLCPPTAHRRWARRTGIGANKHGENNWKQGDWKFVVSCFDHLEDHINKLKLHGNEDDDNSGAMMWNVAAIIWYEENKPLDFSRALLYLRNGRPE